MSKNTLNLVVLIAIIAFFASTAFASTASYGIMVSCTIPAIPGVNAPAVTADESAAQEQQAKQEEAQVEEEQMLPAEQEGTLVATKTVYSR